MASTTLTVRLAPELKDRLGKLAERTRRTKSFLAGEAIAGYVERELEIVSGIERGLDDMKAGRVVSHEDVMADIDATIKKAKTKRPKR
ncbi:MAG: CopG family ribbon-helix-helix protein [Proteobacteria bacterium]|nr:CopG family ribbon-helix-helix protein [Pseudomonadota bacterium]MCH8096208.1 CopG family ribbon-helix-helix protein [Pseudomonadota bacterium]